MSTVSQEILWDAQFYPTVRFWSGNIRIGRNSAAACAGKIRRFWTGLFDLARLHVQAGVYASRPWPLETILVSILIEQDKALAGLRGKLKGLEDTVGKKDGIRCRSGIGMK